MGYTHYWKFKEVKPIKGQHPEIEKMYQLGIRQCQRIIKAYNSQFEKGDDRRLSGYSAHTKVNDYLGLDVNGVKDNSHETFSFRDHWSSNESFNFCKTARKPYDIVVVACLITMQYYMGDLLQVSSDGDVSDWNNGMKLAKKVLKIKGLKIPQNIRYPELEVVS